MTMPLSTAQLMRRQPKQKRSQQRVKKILEAAAVVFAEMGYEAANTHVIAARAGTSVGSLYQFFPDKLSLFHSLEAQHMAGLTATVNQLLETADLEGSFSTFIDHLVETLAAYFQKPIPHLLYLKYFTAPDLFRLFDRDFDNQLIEQFAAFLRRWNPHLSLTKSMRLARTVQRCYNSLLLDALQGDVEQRQACYSELKALLSAYLQPHVQPASICDAVLSQPCVCNATQLGQID